MHIIITSILKEVKTSYKLFSKRGWFVGKNAEKSTRKRQFAADASFIETHPINTQVG